MAKTMAVTVTKKAPAADLSGAFYVGQLVPDTEYETGGDTLVNPNAPALGLPAKVDFIVLTGRGGGYRAEYVPSTGKVKVTVAGKEGEVAKEVAAKTDLSAQVFDFFALGAS